MLGREKRKKDSYSKHILAQYLSTLIVSNSFGPRHSSHRSTEKNESSLHSAADTLPPPQLNFLRDELNAQKVIISGALLKSSGNRGIFSARGFREKLK